MKNRFKSTYLLTQCTISQRLRLVVFNGTFNNIFSYIVGKNNPIHYPYPHSYVLFNYLPPLPMIILDAYKSETLIFTPRARIILYISNTRKVYQFILKTITLYIPDILFHFSTFLYLVVLVFTSIHAISTT